MTQRNRKIVTLLRALRNVLIVLVAAFLALVGLNFPRDYDRALSQEELEAARRYYEDAYRRKDSPGTTAKAEYQKEYEGVAEGAADEYDVPGLIRRFVANYNLADRAILDIGSGRGYLQDVVRNYTGLDISPSVAPLYRKKFVVGSATAMPFDDNTFDAAWSVWVFEHVPNPEQAFAEARRATKNGGLLFLMPAWNCVSWAADGYLYRPYSDFGLWGRLVKASLYLRVQPLYEIFTLAPVRAVRQFAPNFGPTRLRYHRLTPNYEKYWQRDSDAVNSIDWHEAQLWFTSRGDECLNCDGQQMSFPVGVRPLIIRIHK